MAKKVTQMTLEDALKEIDRLQAQNAALRGKGKVNWEAKNSVFLDMFGRKEYLIKFTELCTRTTRMLPKKI